MKSRLARRVLAAISALLPFLAQIVPAQSAPSTPRPPVDVRALHVDWLGGDPRERGDWSFHGVLEQDGSAFPYRAFVRREPFGFREEIDVAGATHVRLSDGRYAWRIGPEELLDASSARACIESAFWFGGVYLDDGRGVGAEPQQPLPAWIAGQATGQSSALRPRTLTIPVDLATAAGTILRCYFDAGDGRLFACHDVGVRPERRLLFGDWRECDGVKVAMTQTSMLETGGEGSVLRLDAARSGLTLASELFPAAPVPEAPGTGRTSPLLVGYLEVPGAAYPLLRGVRINGAEAVALVDSGCSSSLFLAPTLGNEARTPVRGVSAIRSLFGDIVVQRCWVDELEFGDRLARQIVAHSGPMPGYPGLGAADQPQCLLGGLALLRDSPVFDLRARTLRWRGAGPVTALTADADARLHVELRKSVGLDYALLHAKIEIDGRSIDAIVDTGVPFVLRLTVPALRALGLPDTREAWLARGAIGFEASTVGGQQSAELLARLPRVRLGPVEFERPYVMLAGFDREPSETETAGLDALLGFGALAAFRAVGIDWGRARLELELDPERATAPGFVIADPGEFTGIVLAPLPHSRVPPRIRLVLAGTPAARAGLQPGDALISVGRSPTIGRPLHDVARELWGTRGEPLAIGFHRPGDADLSQVRLEF